MRQARYIFFLLPLFFVLACAASFAQANSEITGIVTDQTGAVIAGANLTLVDEATKGVKTTVSSGTGLYDFGGLNPSNYDLKVTAKGFEGYTQTGIVVDISATVRSDIKLTVGAESTTVSVVADALAVQADSNVVSTLINDTEISQLATENRNFVALAALGLGVTNNLPDSNSVTAVTGSWAISFNGLSQAHNVWLIDGGESYDRGSGGKSALQPSQDALAEFNVLASNYPPDYGISTGGTISMALKSGASKYHGTLYEEDRNTDFDANTYQNKLSSPASARPATHYNIYGGNFSGPIPFGALDKSSSSGKSKTFFFWNEEWRKTTNGANDNAATLDAKDFPTAANEVGGMLPYVAPAFATAAPGSKTGTIIPQLIVPSAIGNTKLLNQYAALLLAPGDCFNTKALPVVNAAGGKVCGDGTGAANIPVSLFDPNAVLYLNAGIIPTGSAAANDFYVSNGSLPENAREDLVRIDHNFNDKWSLMGHWIGESLLQNEQAPFLGWAGASYTTITTALNSPSNSAVIKLTGTLSPDLLVEASINYDGNELVFADSANGNKPAGWSVNPPTAAFPLTARTVVPAIYFGAPYNTNEETSTSPYANAARDYEPKVDLSYTKGKHALKFGFSYNRYVKKQMVGGDSQGAYHMNANSNDGIVDLLLGLPSSYSQEQTTPMFHWFSQTPSVYALDNWHVTPRLSLQLGLRYDAMPHTVERSNSMANFVPSLYSPALEPTWVAGDGTIDSTGPGVQTIGGVPLYTNGLALASQDGTPRGLVNNDYKTWQPRVGFSEDLFGNGKTVLRGGFGTFYERMQGNDVFDMGSNSPFVANLGLSNTEFTNPGTDWTDNLVPGAGTLPTFVTGLTTLNTTYKAPGSAMFSLGVQHELAPSLILQVQYVGNIDWHQSTQIGINTFPLSTPLQTRANNGDPNNKAAGDTTDVSLGNTANTLVTYQGWSNITQAQNTQTGDYNSLQAGLRVQNKWGLSGEVDYTYAHQIDSTNGSQDLDNTSDPWNLKYDKGSGVLDRRQQLSADYVYKMPFFEKEHGLVHTVAGGWTLAGTIVANTGLNSTPKFTSGYDTVGLDNQNNAYTIRPDIAGKPSYTKKYGQWFDPTAFTAPTPAWLGGSNQGFGNAGKDAVVGPGRVNFTTSLYKNFAFTERVNFKLEFQSFNTFNHTEFDGIDTNTGDGNFGAVTGLWDPRSLQLGGHFTF